MEPRIQYAQTKDGVSIAFWAVGEGTPLVHMPSAPYNPSLRLWHTPEGRRWCERLAEKRKFVRYDNRGFGHSEREVSNERAGRTTSDCGCRNPQRATSEELIQAD